MARSSAFRAVALSVLVGLLAIGRGIGAQPADVVIVAGTHTFHLKGCQQISAYSDSYLRSIDRSSLDSSYTPCSWCRPDAKRTASAPTISSADVEELWSRYDGAETVTIVTGAATTGLYHRRGCYWLLIGGSQIFTRKEADSRMFQPHHECMRKPPNTNLKPTAPGTQSATPAPAARPLVGDGTSTPVERPSTPTIRNTERQQCAATTRKGTRCSRMAQPGRAYCWQH